MSEKEERDIPLLLLEMYGTLDRIDLFRIYSQAMMLTSTTSLNYVHRDCKYIVEFMRH